MAVGAAGGAAGGTAGVAVGVAAVLLLGLTAVTARPPSTLVPDRDGYFERWSVLHGGYDARSARVVGAWLTLAYRVARPLARAGVQPDVLTVWGLLLSVAVVPLADAGSRWPLLATVVVVGSGLLDNLDGTVAVLTDRATRFGFVLDSLVDRLADAVYLIALWRLGAPAGVCVAAGAALGLLEYTRARAGNAGMRDIGVVTVGERATRIVVTAITLFCAGLYVGHAGLVAALGAAATLGLSAVGLGQLLVVVRRTLR